MGNLENTRRISGKIAIIGSNLTDEYWLYGGQQNEIAKSIIGGIPEKGMISWRNHLSPTEIGSLVAFIAPIQGSNPENAKAPQGEKE